MDLSYEILEKLSYENILAILKEKTKRKHNKIL